MKDKLFETGGKENLTIVQGPEVDNDWPEVDFEDLEEFDIASAIYEAHDDPC